jgi:opacity protein-like surface antigen
MTRIGTVLLAWMLPAVVMAQPAPPQPRHRDGGMLCFYGMGGAPTGYFGQVVGGSWGLGLAGVWQPRRRSLGLRLEGSYTEYGSVSREVPIAGAGGRVMGDLTTTNEISNFAIGPQLTIGHGALRPYLVAAFGSSYFATRTLLKEDHDCPDEDCVIASDTNYSDWTFAWSAGGGILLSIGRRAFVDVGVRYVGNGTVNWLAEGDLVDDGDGPARPLPRRSEANVVQVTAGFVFAF